MKNFQMKFLPFFMLLGIFLLSKCTVIKKQAKKSELPVIAYYAGDAKSIDRYPVDKLTHIIYSFLHLKGNRLAIDNQRDSMTLRKLVSLKADHPNLEVLVALGGWGGCETCSEVFSTARGRQGFASSTKQLLQKFNADGIDLDWEYPAIQGPPGHPYSDEDTRNFTLLVRELRKELGNEYEISFAAGAFKRFFDHSVTWNQVMPLVDRVHLMTYDFVSGGSTQTGHLSSLYSTDQQTRSADYAVRYLDSLGVPKEKMVIGAAFYVRMWEEVPPKNNGLYQHAQYHRSLKYRDLDEYLIDYPGFIKYQDQEAKAPYLYHPGKRLFVTYDDSLSVALKTRYALDNNLGGFMFWELGGDEPQNGLLESIYKTKEEAQ